MQPYDGLEISLCFLLLFLLAWFALVFMGNHVQLLTACALGQKKILLHNKDSGQQWYAANSEYRICSGQDSVFFFSDLCRPRRNQEKAANSLLLFV
ncbi:hypothetical protein VNO77_17094 [Canavalia gladiata]|uniref:Uncharacterized protein n=1 Tax=Canavalia gladiata TaxID=3824 RepID=A0AAN9LIA4_CANGL